MQYVQLVFTTDHVAELKDALGLSTVDPETEPQRFQRLGFLEAFLAQVLETPDAFPVTGRMADAIKTRVRKLKGPAEPRPANKRKARQERRMRTAKARRRQRREQVEAYNAARERVEEEVREMLEIQAERQDRRNALVIRDELTHAEVAELFELFDVPHVAEFLRKEHDLTPQERLERASAAA